MNRKVRSVTRFGGVMLRQSWGFSVFAVISVLLIIFLQNLLQGDIGMGEHRVSLPASAPWLSTCFFDITQSSMFVLVIGEVMARDKHRILLEETLISIRIIFYLQQVKLSWMTKIQFF